MTKLMPVLISLLVFLSILSRPFDMLWHVMTYYVSMFCEGNNITSEIACKKDNRMIAGPFWDN